MSGDLVDFEMLVLSQIGLMACLIVVKVAKKRFPLEQWYPNSDWLDLLISDWLASEALSKSSDKNLAQTHSFSVLYQDQKFEFLC